MASITGDLSELTWWLVCYIPQERGPSGIKLERLSMEVRQCLLTPWHKMYIFLVCLLFLLLGKSSPTLLGLSGTQSNILLQRRGYNLAGQSRDSIPQAGDTDVLCSPAIMVGYAHRSSLDILLKQKDFGYMSTVFILGRCYPPHTHPEIWKYLFLPVLTKLKYLFLKINLINNKNVIILIYISLIYKELESFSYLLAICISSLEKYLLRSSHHFFLTHCLLFAYWVVWVTYIFWILTLY